jgi:hypothetical protein
MMGGGRGMAGRNSSLEKLLEEEDCTVERVLNEADLLNECKWGNSKLMAL